jgi:hypothetical protein
LGSFACGVGLSLLCYRSISFDPLREGRHSKSNRQIKAPQAKKAPQRATKKSKKRTVKNPMRFKQQLSGKQ